MNQDVLIKLILILNDKQSEEMSNLTVTDDEFATSHLCRVTLSDVIDSLSISCGSMKVIYCLPSAFSHMNKAVAENAAVDLDYEIYNVVKGDTLWRIASDKLGNGTRHNEIKELNVLDSDILSPGQKRMAQKLSTKDSFFQLF